MAKTKTGKNFHYGRDRSMYSDSPHDPSITP